MLISNQQQQLQQMDRVILFGRVNWMFHDKCKF